MVNTNRESGKAHGTPLHSLHMNEEITGKSSTLGRYRIGYVSCLEDIPYVEACTV